MCLVTKDLVIFKQKECMAKLWTDWDKKMIEKLHDHLMGNLEITKNRFEYIRLLLYAERYLMDKSVIIYDMFFDALDIGELRDIPKFREQYPKINLNYGCLSKDFEVDSLLEYSPNEMPKPVSESFTYSVNDVPELDWTDYLSIPKRATEILPRSSSSDDSDCPF